MGNNYSSIDPIHVRIYSNLIKVKDPAQRVSIINMCLASLEYVTSAKKAGIYSYLLNYVATVNSGRNPPLLPGEHENTQENQIIMPRSMQPNFNGANTNTTPHSNPHSTPHKYRGTEEHQLSTYKDTTPSWKIVTDTPKQKALSYFSSCLELLEVGEEVALTDEILKSAYRRIALKAHPDKGGSEEYFEAITRAYAYLSEILKHMQGNRKDLNSKVETPNVIINNRDTDSTKWKHAEPVRLNAKNLDMNAFNKLFEETHIPDPDSDGYGDWLKTHEDKNTNKSSVPKFSGKFNRDVFNRMFEDESRKSAVISNAVIIHPEEMALTLNPTNGANYIGERVESYTAAPNSKFQFTDLRGAYTTETTISDKIANVQVSDRNYEQYRASREKAPDPFTQTELHSINEFQRRQRQQDELREHKRAEMAVRNQNYFDKMKSLVITEGVDDQKQKKLTY